MTWRTSDKRLLVFERKLSVTTADIYKGISNRKKWLSTYKCVCVCALTNNNKFTAQDFSTNLAYFLVRIIYRITSRSGQQSGVCGAIPQVGAEQVFIKFRYQRLWRCLFELNARSTLYTWEISAHLVFYRVKILTGVQVFNMRSWLNAKLVVCVRVVFVVIIVFRAALCPSTY